MDCRETGTLLIAYHDGELPEVDRTRVETHLHGCPACRALLAGLAHADEAAGVPEPGPEYWSRFNDRVLARVEREASEPMALVLRPKHGWVRQQLRYLVPAIAAAALVVVVVRHAAIVPEGPTASPDVAAAPRSTPLPDAAPTFAPREALETPAPRRAGPTGTATIAPPVAESSPEAKTEAAVPGAEETAPGPAVEPLHRRMALRRGTLTPELLASIRSHFTPRRNGSAPGPPYAAPPAGAESPAATAPVQDIGRLASAPPPPAPAFAGGRSGGIAREEIESGANRMAAVKTQAESPDLPAAGVASPAPTPTMRSEAKAESAAKSRSAKDESASPCELARRLSAQGRLKEAEVAQRACLKQSQAPAAQEDGLLFLAELLDRQTRFAEADAVIEETQRQFPRSRPLDRYMQQRPMLQRQQLSPAR